tara:strand:- start:253 stop:726 length:474 start_codon:yes stop_codon:yes gene_type:complete
MESLDFYLYGRYEDTGQRSDDGKRLKMEAQNDPKYLVSLLNAINTAVDPFKSRRRTILRIFDRSSALSRTWAIEAEQGKLFSGEEPVIEFKDTISMSPEGLEFLNELVKNPPSDIKFQSIPVQKLLVSIEDQYDAWKKSQDGEKDESPSGKEKVEPS